ncbi:MAG: PorV/PorQ family protein [Bacteroidota bacterium]
MIKQLKHIWTVMVVVIFLVVQPGYSQLLPNLGGQRVGISAYQFLKINVGARASALGESFVALANDASCLYWNPAGMTQFSQTEFMVAHTIYVLDIKHEYLAGVYHPDENNAVGLSVIALTMPDMEVTTEAQPFGTGRYFSYGDFALGLSYGRRMTDQFSFGTTIRLIDETLGDVKMNGITVDFGTYYWTGIGSTRFAIVIVNFGPDVAPSGTAKMYDGTAVTSFQSFAPPTEFKLGFAWDPYMNEHQRTTLSLALVHPNDNVENFNFGVEYKWQEWLSLRGTIRRAIGEQLLGADQTGSGDFTLGMGVGAPVEGSWLNFDYAFTDFSLLGSIHRVSVLLSW